MAIDVSLEVLLDLNEAAYVLPNSANGKKLSTSVIFRWMMRGVSGVRLESVRIGRKYFTSIEALKRFGVKLEEQDAARTGTRSKYARVFAVRRPRRNFRT